MLRMILLLLVLHLSLSLEEPSIDPNGYVMFCPCMGRFGNQAEQFLGAMGFTHRLNRTLVLPHWIEYPTRTATSVQIPFDRYFQVAPLQKYLRVILMEEFMDKLASKVWPKGKRFVFCYMAQEDDKNAKQTCKAKEGNPFGPYWNKFHIDFDGDVFYKPLYFDIPSAEPWNTKFPPAEYPVFAFSGPPSGFPTEQSNIPLAKYLVYSDYIREKANKFLNQHGIQAANLLALHIRNGVDFERACSYAQPGTNFFASAQCLGYEMNKGVELTKEVCYPSEVTLLRQTEKKVKEVQPKVIYIASDGESLLSKFQKRLEKKYQLKVIQYSRPTTQSEGEAAHMDLYILSVAEHAIVNCPSSFSAFAKRQRDRLNKSTDFWGISIAQYKREMNSDL